MSRTPPGWRVSLTGAFVMFGTASAAIASIGCVPERDRQDPREGLKCNGDQKRCGDPVDLVCHLRYCHQPCNITAQCTADETDVCIDGLCQ